MSVVVLTAAADIFRRKIYNRTIYVIMLHVYQCSQTTRTVKVNEKIPTILDIPVTTFVAVCFCREYKDNQLK